MIGLVHKYLLKHSGDKTGDPKDAMRDHIISPPVIRAGRATTAPVRAGSVSGEADRFIFT